MPPCRVQHGFPNGTVLSVGPRGVPGSCPWMSRMRPFFKQGHQHNLNPQGRSDSLDISLPWQLHRSCHPVQECLCTVNRAWTTQQQRAVLGSEAQSHEYKIEQCQGDKWAISITCLMTLHSAELRRVKKFSLEWYGRPAHKRNLIEIMEIVEMRST